MLKHKLSEILSYGKVLIKKTENRIRYRNLGSYISEDFGNKEMLIKYNRSRTTGPQPCVCFAPSRSIYFDIHGKATACCFNRPYVFGKFPENTLEEIINGEKRKFLQNELCRQNFMYGCQHCHKLIEGGNFEGLEARLYDNLKDQNYLPSEIVFELDNTCNLECLMCHEEFSSSIARTKNLDKIMHPYNSEFIEQLKPYIVNLKVAKFLGGEPFLINIYYEIWDLIIEINPKCKIILQTNGTIFNDRIKSYLERGNFYIGISVDSLKKEVFEYIRKNAEFDKVMKNIEKFITISRKKNNYVNISVCPMQQNWKEIPDLVEFCNRHNVFIYFNTVYTEGFALSELSHTELSEILDLWKARSFGKLGIIGRRNVEGFRGVVSQFEKYYQTKYDDYIKNAKRHLFTIDMLKEIFIDKLRSDEKAYSAVLDVFEIIKVSSFYLSDKDVFELQNITEDQIKYAVETMTKNELQNKLSEIIGLDNN